MKDEYVNSNTLLHI